MTKKTLDQLKALYQKGALKLEQLDSMLAAGKITQEEYDYIITPENK